MQSKHLFRLAMVAGLTLSATAQAALYDRGGGLIYDDDRNITWLADANYAKTSGYDADGAMDWVTAKTWAANLSYFDAVRGVTYTDWRLPNLVQPDLSCGSQSGGDSYGDFCSGSEMGHLFYQELSGISRLSIIYSGDADLSLFQNIQAPGYAGGIFWTESEYSSTYAWYFSMAEGIQNRTNNTREFYAWAVRPGDVAAVPEADTWALMLAGLGLVGLAVKRRQRVGS